MREVESSKNLASKNEVETRLDLGYKNREIIKKLQTLYLTYFIGKSYVDDDGSQNYLIFQPVQFLSILKFLVVLLITLLQ